MTTPMISFCTADRTTVDSHLNWLFWSSRYTVQPVLNLSRTSDPETVYGMYRMREEAEQAFDATNDRVYLHTADGVRGRNRRCVWMRPYRNCRKSMPWFTVQGLSLWRHRRNRRKWPVSSGWSYPLRSWERGCFHSCCQSNYCSGFYFWSFVFSGCKLRDFSWEVFYIS